MAGQNYNIKVYNNSVIIVLLNLGVTMVLDALDLDIAN